MQLVPYFIAVPLATGFAIPILGKRCKTAVGISAAFAAFLLSAISFAIIPAVISGKIISYSVGNITGPASLSIAVDGLSAFMLVTVNTVAFLITMYSADYMRRYTDNWKFFSLLMLMLAGINGVLIATDIFNLYVFLEIAAIAGYFLVAFGVEDESLEAAFKYAVMGSVASIFILLGIALLYSYTSTLNMSDMALVLSRNGSAKAIQFVSILFLMGFGLKAALSPFHAWLPYAHSSAPAPISAMLSGISIKVLGIYAIARIFFNVFGMTPVMSSVIITFAVLSMVVGSFLAFGQSDIKRLFAYSSISQIGYIALGLALATPLGIIGALLHLFNHSIFKSLLFLNSGAIERTKGTRDLNRISGVVYTNPVSGYTSLIGAASICGLPPLGGFWSKLIIILACVQAGRPVLAFIAVSMSILTLAYYFKNLAPALFGKGSELRIYTVGHKISFVMGLPLIILAVLSVVSVFMLLPNMSNVLLKEAAGVLMNGKDLIASMPGLLK